MIKKYKESKINPARAGKKNTDEIDELSKTNEIRPFGSLFSCKVAGFTWFLVLSRNYGIYSHV